MPKSPWSAAIAALSLFLPLLVQGQETVRPGPGDPQAVSPAMKYESVFRGYRMFTDEKVVSWRATNDLVQKLGGWRAFASDKVPDLPPVTAPAEEIATKAPMTAPTVNPAPKSSPPASSPAKPSPGGHAGHK